MSTDGCSGKMDIIAKWVNKIRTGEHGRKLAFTRCCEEHDEVYGIGGTWKDRWIADKTFRKCIKENLKSRNRSMWICFHVPWVFWLGVRLGGKLSWGKID